MPVQTTRSSVTEGHVDSWPKMAAFLRWVGQSLVAAGAIWVYVPPPQDPAEEWMLSQPPPGHPEQLRSDLPLTAEERDLARRLSNPKETA